MQEKAPDWKWLSACLRISGDEVDPDSVTKALGLEPNFTGRKGQRVGGKSKSAVFESNLWGHIFSEEFHEPFDAQLSEFVGRLEKRGKQLRALYDRKEVGAELLLGFASSNGQGGFTLPAELLARIAALGLDVSLDLYPPPPQAE